MGDHVFVSYSRDDHEYVDRLRAAFAEWGIDSWSDEEIPYGEDWTAEIRKRLDSSAAVVVVMSPDAEESSWVGREIEQAEFKKRPIFPLLLLGDRFFRLAHLQYADVRGGVLPSKEWFSAIGRLVGAGTDGTAVDQQQREDEARRLAEEQARLAEARRVADEQARQQAEAKRLAEQEAAEEAARQEAAEQARRRAEEEEERRRRRRRAILIGSAAVVGVVAVVGLIIALAGGGGDGGNGGGDGQQTAEVTVAGDQIWTETDIDCEAGDSLAVTADGTVFHNEETSTGPDGDSSVPPEFNVFSDAPHAALIGRIGDDGTFFLVGSSFTQPCPAAGSLSLGVNDAGPENNRGEFNATVEVQPAG